MEANLLVRHSTERNKAHVVSSEIFSDCIECGEIRTRGPVTKFTAKGKILFINTISCDCSPGTSHADLVIEAELITILKTAGIQIDI